MIQKSEQKLTPWFPAGMKPARPGVYQRMYKSTRQNIGFARWDGRKWYFRRTNAILAAAEHQSSPIQDREWRGLAEQPK